jgi:hypothetical protein
MHDESLMHHEDLPEFTNLFWSGADIISRTFNDKAPELSLQQFSQGKTLKLQCNTGNGGCFPWHYDNVGRPNKSVLHPHALRTFI